ncbi:hypothetical protein MMC29_004386 [Sticta canariensis]|nr:hypothetical protein [Sticta canariensis]
MPIIRKRRAQAEPSPSPPATRRRKSPSLSEASVEDGEDSNALDGDTRVGGGSHGQMVKKLVRLALACEYSRQPIRRADITSKGA